jgi:hypothetical protein
MRSENKEEDENPQLSKLATPASEFHQEKVEAPNKAYLIVA